MVILFIRCRLSLWETEIFQIFVFHNFRFIVQPSITIFPGQFIVEQLKDCRGGAPNISRVRIDHFVYVSYLLWRLVEIGTHAHGIMLDISDLFGYAEIYYLDDAFAIFYLYSDIVRLNISVSNLMVVHAIHRVDDLPDNTLNFFRIMLIFFSILQEGMLTVFHHDKTI